MSYFNSPDPDMIDPDQCPDKIDTVIIPRSHDIGGFEVHRALPSRQRRMVGPFIFWDQMGPGELITGTGIDVRPHPHINLSTMTYLFDGVMRHQDSLGYDMVVKPGAVNLMSAGSGIAHSERTPMEERDHDNKLFGIQSWLALPKNLEEMDPALSHTDKEDLPLVQEEGLSLRLVMGEGWGMKSPVPMHWDTFYADIKLERGARIDIPPQHEERALYPLYGRVQVNDTVYEPGRLLVLKPGDAVSVTAVEDVRLLAFGGAVMDGPRHIWWNFVSSSKERIEQAKADWKNRRFPKIPTDKADYIPLPD